jgi:type IV secretory pathway VirB2 component (pilin)
MSRRYRIVLSQRATHRLSRFCRQAAPIVLTLLFLPIAAYAQSGSPFDTGFTALQTLFTGTIAKVASLIAIVIGPASAVASFLPARRAASVNPVEALHAE